MEEFLLVVAELYMFESRANLKKTLLEILDCQATDAKNINGQFSHQKIPPKLEYFDANPDRKYKACIFCEI